MLVPFMAIFQSTICTLVVILITLSPSRSSQVLIALLILILLFAIVKQKVSLGDVRNGRVITFFE